MALRWSTPEDFDNALQTLNFAGTAGETRQTFTVATLDDAVLEAAETFTVSLSASDPLVADIGTGTGTIDDNDAAPALAMTQTVTDLNGGAVTPGDTLLYTITIVNSGVGDATVGRRHEIRSRSNTTLVAGSLTSDDPTDILTTEGRAGFTADLGTLSVRPERATATW